MSKEEMMKMLLESEKLGLQDARILENLLDRDSIIYIVSIFLHLGVDLCAYIIYNDLCKDINRKEMIICHQELVDHHYKTFPEQKNSTSD